MGLTGIYKTFYPTAEYIFFSSIHRIFSRMDHMLSHKTNLNKLKTEMMPDIFSSHSGTKLEINNKRKIWKSTNIWKLTYSWTTTGSKKKSKEKSKNTLRQKKWNCDRQIRGMQQEQFRRKVCGNKCLSQETRKSETTLYFKELGRDKKPKFNTRKRITKIRTEINKIESQKTIEKIKETKNWFFEKITKLTNL